MNNEIVELDETDQLVDIGDQAATGTDDDATDVPLVNDGFQVVDAASASWVARRINEARAYARRVELWAEREIRRAKRDEDHLMFRFGQQLQDYAAREIAKLRGRRRSICLPGGTIGYRRVGPTLVFDDPARVLVWAKAQCADAVVASEKLAKSAVNRHIESTGEIPDGAHIEVGRDKFFVG
jgi:hypothetical protein